MIGGKKRHRRIQQGVSSIAKENFRQYWQYPSMHGFTFTYELKKNPMKLIREF